MKPILPHDPLDDLIAAALHGELTPEEHITFESRLQNDPAARAAYLETQHMHDLLEKTHREAQPDPAFEQRMVSGVRRKLQDGGQPRETAWESVLVLWRGVRGALRNRWVVGGALACAVLLVATLGMEGRLNRPALLADFSPQQDKKMAVSSENDSQQKYLERYLKIDDADKKEIASAQQLQAGADTSSPAPLNAPSMVPPAGAAMASGVPSSTPFAAPMAPPAATAGRSGNFEAYDVQARSRSVDSLLSPNAKLANNENAAPVDKPVSAGASRSVTTKNESAQNADVLREYPNPATASPTPDVSRKLIRNAQLDLEVKEYQPAMDQIAALTKAAGGYVDTSNSQRGGNGKLQGTVVVKVLPENLDGFLLKLRDLGEIKNQSVSTDDVTKAYYDTQARLDNSRRMETQLQELLKRDNGKVSELLEVERELGRVRGEIEQMQGELKLYDFQVQYATVSLSVQEKDLKEAAAYLLQERDDFSLFATDVEGTFQQARHAADDCKAQILNASLNHNSGSDVSAQLVVSVPPEQIEAFLAQIRSLGRVANFTRQTNRVARDGGNTDQPADETRTEKDRVLVNLSIRSDDDTRKQVAMTVVTPAVDDALDQAKTAALASPGAEILSSSLNKTAQGQSTAQISVRVPGKSYSALLAAFRALGRTSSFSLQRDDNAGPNTAGDDAPVILSLALTDDEAPLQQTELVVRATDVDVKSQQLKKDAAAAGVEVKASSFERQPDGIEIAQMTFRLPLSNYAGFLAKLKNLGQVEALSVNREDRPDQARPDDSAPAEISLRLHNEGPVVPDDNGLWATLRRTFGEGAAALLGSVRTIGVLVAFLMPWFLLLSVTAWIGRRIYVGRRAAKNDKPRE